MLDQGQVNCESVCVVLVYLSLLLYQPATMAAAQQAVEALVASPVAEDGDICYTMPPDPQWLVVLKAFAKKELMARPTGEDLHTTSQFAPFKGKLNDLKAIHPFLKSITIIASMCFVSSMCFDKRPGCGRGQAGKLPARFPPLAGRRRLCIAASLRSTQLRARTVALSRCVVREDHPANARAFAYRQRCSRSAAVTPPPPHPAPRH